MIRLTMDAASSVRIGNNLSYIDANNGVTKVQFMALYMILPMVEYQMPVFTALVPGPIDGEPYSLILNANGNGTATSDNFAFYGASPFYSFQLSRCCTRMLVTSGIVNGPATTGPSMPTIWGCIWQLSPVLPVHLVQFLADKNDDGSVKLSWATAQEQNASHFEIERSGDQANWTSLGSVKAKGYSSTTSNY